MGFDWFFAQTGLGNPRFKIVEKNKFKHDRVGLLKMKKR